jgi:uncharacterized iron-regulated membrane protein
MMNKKRQMWVQCCLLWTAIWFFLGIFLWPFLFLAAISAFMILIPVGVSANEPPTRQHDPNAWRTDQKRPWR